MSLGSACFVLQYSCFFFFFSGGVGCLFLSCLCCSRSRPAPNKRISELDGIVLSRSPAKFRLLFSSSAPEFCSLCLHLGFILHLIHARVRVCVRICVCCLKTHTHARIQFSHAFFAIRKDTKIIIPPRSQDDISRSRWCTDHVFNKKG